MNVLALNAGSSTLKYKLFSMPDEEVLSEGGVEHAEGDGISGAANDAIHRSLELKIDVIVHRVVHGGSRFTHPTIVSMEMLAELAELKDLDPLHNPTEVAMIRAGLDALPDIPAVAVFDTAFHQTLPEVAWRYALPRDISERLKLRRYGFHGISYQFVSGELLKCIGREAHGTKLVVCHLGSGASICAIKDGKSIDTSMGMTPLEGLVMGTRAGDVDPGLLTYLLRVGKLTSAELDNILNYDSGLRGLSDLSGDLREVEKTAENGDLRAEIALEIFAYRACKYIGAYAAALEGLDAIAFTGGIGEHSASIRQRICSRLEFMGIKLDTTANNNALGDVPKRIDSNGQVSVWVIPTDEELQMARESYNLLANNG